MPLNNTLFHKIERTKFSDPESIRREIEHIAATMFPGFDFSFLAKAFSATVDLFQGRYPGYRKSNTKYHDLEHTTSVALAVARLAHGAVISGRLVTPRGFNLASAAALFHDSGLIQTEDDQVGTGAKYTIGHEERSIRFMSRYLEANGYSPKDVADCGLIIESTIMSKPFSEIPFDSDEIRLLGQIMGAGDLLAQMADRAYLEKLFLLYREFEEAGVSGFDSELMLLEKTEGFYENVAKKRFDNELGRVNRFMRLHFNTRWGLDADPYQESLIKNIKYLKIVLEECRKLYRGKFRRNGLKW